MGGYAHPSLGSVPLPQLGVYPFCNLSGVIYDSILMNDIGAGNVDLTLDFLRVNAIPAGYRALVFLHVFNTAGTTTTWYPELKDVSANYWRLQPNITTATLSQGTNNPGFIWEAGETISLNTSQAGLNVFATVILFPNSNPLRSARFLSTAWTNGDNTVYTCPAGKISIAQGFSSMFNSAGGSGQTYVNSSGASATVGFYVNRNGQGAETNLFANNNNAVVANGATAGGDMETVLQPGDFINVKTNQTAAQVWWMNVLELPLTAQA